MSDRRCARKGCNNTLEHMGSRASYCSNGCRTAAYKEREGIVAYRPVRTSQNGRRGGRQVSFRKAVDVMVEEFSPNYPEGFGIPAGVIERALGRAIPERQR